jgi:glyoxylase-like metal-dependent hydrolase (beta-lactamase superfamily II)
MKHSILAIALLWFYQVLFAQSFTSPHFILEKLDDGVWAAIATNGGHAICNAGIIDLGEETLIFDSFMTPEAAEDLRRTAKELTGREAKYLVNSHYHNDHIGGNQVFEDATIISTKKTRDLIAKYQPEEIEFAKSEDAVKRLAKYTSADLSTMNDHDKTQNVMWKGYYECYVSSADILRIELPTLLVESELTIAGTKQTAHLFSYGEGHTEADLFLYLPETKILFLGDLLFIENQPWMREANLDGWIARLDSIKTIDSHKIVPGHGPVGAKADIASMVDYFNHVKETAKTFKKKNMSPANDASLTAPAPYNAWNLSAFYVPNVIAMYEALKE